MRCPFCGHAESQVKDSRPAEDGAAIRRRRFCPECAGRFTTFERLEEVPLLVVKRSGDRVPFDRRKIVDGVRAAAKGRPLDDSVIDAAVDDVEDSARLQGPEVASEQLAVTDRRLPGAVQPRTDEPLRISSEEGRLTLAATRDRVP